MTATQSRIEALLSENDLLRKSRRALAEQEQTSRVECNRLRASIKVKNEFIKEVLQVTEEFLDDETGHFTKHAQAALDA